LLDAGLQKTCLVCQKTAPFGELKLQVPPKLTRREREITPFLLSGATRNEIASTLGVSPETVKQHIKNLLSKFEALTVRDAFVDLNNYQKYYGVGGLGLTRFVIKSSMKFELLPGRNGAKVCQTDTMRP